MISNNSEFIPKRFSRLKKNRPQRPAAAAIHIMIVS
jgi:hypothetical protein